MTTTRDLPVFMTDEWLDNAVVGGEEFIIAEHFIEGAAGNDPDVHQDYRTVRARLPHTTAAWHGAVLDVLISYVAGAMTIHHVCPTDADIAELARESRVTDPISADQFSVLLAAARDVCTRGLSGWGEPLPEPGRWIVSAVALAVAWCLETNGENDSVEDALRRIGQIAYLLHRPNTES